jgi:hypothetical protein
VKKIEISAEKVLKNRFSELKKLCLPNKKTSRESGGKIVTELKSQEEHK